MIKSANSPKPMQPDIVDHGMFAEHNMPCAVCLKGFAMLRMNTGVFHPCTACDEEGWTLTKRKKRPWWAFWK